MSVNGSQIEGVTDIKSAIFNHFTNHFWNVNLDRPSVENLTFKTLNQEQDGVLTKPFCVKEVKQTVWDYGSSKSQGPDGINSNFFKDFWAELKDDIMCFISEFHWNEKLSKGINSTFIDLIP